MLTVERLREALDYDPLTGVFLWRISNQSRYVYPGGPAGSRFSDGYYRIKLDGRSYMAHRLAWLFVHGVWPAAEIDHINGKPADNRIENLREASRTENCRNSRRRRHNPTKFKGVIRSGSKWRAAISVDRRKICLGSFPSPEAAHAAYAAAARQFHGAFARAE